MFSPVVERVLKEIEIVQQYFWVSEWTKIDENTYTMKLFSTTHCAVTLPSNYPFSGPTVIFQDQEITFPNWSPALGLSDVLTYIRIIGYGKPEHKDFKELYRQPDSKEEAMDPVSVSPLNEDHQTFDIKEQSSISILNPRPLIGRPISELFK